jgi:hypothetical protein
VKTGCSFDAHTEEISQGIRRLAKGHAVLDLVEVNVLPQRGRRGDTRTPAEAAKVLGVTKGRLLQRCYGPAARRGEPESAPPAG